MDVSEVKNITISVRGNEICEELKLAGFFNTSVEAYRAAICIAISKELQIDESHKGTLNKWDTASVFRDSESNVEALLLLHGLKPEEIVSQGKLLAEVGLRYIAEKMAANTDVLTVLIG